jgi:hypothetical protein
MLASACGRTVLLLIGTSAACWQLLHQRPKTTDERRRQAELFELRLPPRRLLDDARVVASFAAGLRRRSSRNRLPPGFGCVPRRAHCCLDAARLSPAEHVVRHVLVGSRRWPTTFPGLEEQLVHSRASADRSAPSDVVFSIACTHVCGVNDGSVASHVAQLSKMECVYGEGGGSQEDSAIDAVWGDDVEGAH